MCDWKLVPEFSLAGFDFFWGEVVRRVVGGKDGEGGVEGGKGTDGHTQLYRRGRGGRENARVNPDPIGHLIS